MSKETLYALEKSMDKWLQGGRGYKFPAIVSCEELHQKWGGPPVCESKRLGRRCIKRIEADCNSSGFEWVVFYSRGFFCFVDIEDLVEKRILARTRKVERLLSEAAASISKAEGLVDKAGFTLTL